MGGGRGWWSALPTSPVTPTTAVVVHASSAEGSSSSSCGRGLRRRRRGGGRRDFSDDGSSSTTSRRRDAPRGSCEERKLPFDVCSSERGLAMTSAATISAWVVAGGRIPSVPPLSPSSTTTSTPPPPLPFAFFSAWTIFSSCPSLFPSSGATHGSNAVAVRTAAVPPVIVLPGPASSPPPSSFPSSFRIQSDHGSGDSTCPALAASSCFFLSPRWASSFSNHPTAATAEIVSGASVQKSTAKTGVLGGAIGDGSSGPRRFSVVAVDGEGGGTPMAAAMSCGEGVQKLSL